MAIYDNYIVTVDFRNNVSQLSEDIHLYKNDQNIPLTFEFVEEDGSFFNTVKIDILDKFKADKIKMMILKPNGKEFKTDELEIVKGEVVGEESVISNFKFVVAGSLIDELNEIGDFDIQFRLYREEDCILTLPPILKQFHVHKPIINDADGIGEDVIGDEVEVEENLPAFDDNGEYIKTSWRRKDLISTGRMNKLEEGVYYTSAIITELKKNANSYNTLNDLPSINGVELKGQLSSLRLGLALADHKHDDYLLKDIFNAHNHDDKYVAQNIFDEHNHDDKYSRLDHVHDDRYVVQDIFERHKHDEDYSPLIHAHDDKYSLLDHEHEYSEIKNTPVIVDDIRLNGDVISLTSKNMQVGTEIILPEGVTSLNFDNNILSLRNSQGLIGEGVDLPKYADGLLLTEDNKIQMVSGAEKLGDGIQLQSLKFRKLTEGSITGSSYNEIILEDDLLDVNEIKIRFDGIRANAYSSIRVTINNIAVGDITSGSMSATNSLYCIAEIQDYGYYLMKYAIGNKDGNANWVTRSHFDSMFNMQSENGIKKIVLKGTNLTIDKYEVWGR